MPVLLAAVLLLGAGVYALTGSGREAAEASAAVTDWGLSFQQEGAPPVANATRDYLKILPGALRRRPGEEGDLHHVRRRL